MSKIESEIKEKIYELIKDGFQILYDETGTGVDGIDLKKSKKAESITISYNSWYSQTIPIIKQLIPERYDDFTSLYKSPKTRKFINFETFSIYDYLNGISMSNSLNSEQATLAAFTYKFGQQIAILNSARSLIGSILANIKGVLQAEMFDNELEAAKHLHNKMFYRASGMLSGVVLERHLNSICKAHNLTIPTKPTIANYNELLKNNELIDLPTWRYLSLLGDYRNICSHGKEREPTMDESRELFEGVAKIIKKVY